MTWSSGFVAESDVKILRPPHGAAPGMAFRAGPIQGPVCITDCGRDPCLTVAQSELGGCAHQHMGHPGPWVPSVGDSSSQRWSRLQRLNSPLQRQP